MTDPISNIIDFGEVFNAIRQEQREIIKREFEKYCFEVCNCTHPDGSQRVCDDHQAMLDLLEQIPLNGGSHGV